MFTGYVRLKVASWSSVCRERLFCRGEGICRIRSNTNKISSTKQTPAKCCKENNCTWPNLPGHKSDITYHCLVILKLFKLSPVEASWHGILVGFILVYWRFSHSFFTMIQMCQYIWANYSDQKRLPKKHGIYMGVLLNINQTFQLDDGWWRSHSSKRSHCMPNFHR